MSTPYAYGIVQRLHPYLIPISGYNPLEPQTRITSVPVQAGVTIKSGQIIVPSVDTDGITVVWVLADSGTSAHLKAEPHVALQDSTDYDVVAAGNVLTGLSCSGQFEIQTGYYVAPGGGGAPITNGTVLSFGTGATAGSLTTVLRGAGPTVPVIGIVSGACVAGPIDLTGINSEATNLSVVQWRTHYDSQNAAS